MRDSFEDRLKKIVEQHEESVNQSALWKKIEGRTVGKQKRKNRKLFLFFTIVGLSILFFKTISTDHFIQADKSSIELQNPQFVVDNTNLNFIDCTEKPTNKISIQTSKTNVIKDIKSNIIEKSLSNKETTLEQKEISQNQDISFNQDVNSKLNEANTEKEIEKPVFSNTNTVFIAPIKHNNIVEIENVLEEPLETELTSSSNSLVFGSDKNKQNTLQNIYKELGFDLILNKKLFTLETKKTLNKKIPLPKKIKRPFLSKLNPTLYSGISFGTKQINGSLNSHQSALEKYSASIQIDILHFHNIRLSSGIAWSNIIDFYQWEGVFTENKEQTYVEQIIFMLDNSTVENYATKQDLEVYRNIQKYPNRQMIYIPIRLNYDYQVNTLRLTGYIENQLQYQFASESYGIIDGIPVSEVSKGALQAQNIQLGVGMYYQVIKDWHVGFLPHFQMLQFNLDGDVLSQTHQNRYVGFDLSIIHHL